jgi:hypothetical protein
MSTNKKIDTILSLLEICESNLRNAKTMLSQLSPDSASTMPVKTSSSCTAMPKSSEDANASEVAEGHFDGENMIADNGQVYPIPQNYASKSQLVVGDRMKWILTKDSFGELKEVYKLIQPVLRDRVIGKFVIDDNNYGVLVDGVPNPVKMLKASATYAIKNLGLKIGDEVAIYTPKNTVPTWGAFISVVSTSAPKTAKADDGRRIIYTENADPETDEFDLSKTYF